MHAHGAVQFSLAAHHHACVPAHAHTVTCAAPLGTLLTHGLDRMAQATRGADANFALASSELLAVSVDDEMLLASCPSSSQKSSASSCSQRWRDVRAMRVTRASTRPQLLHCECNNSASLLLTSHNSTFTKSQTAWALCPLRPPQCCAAAGASRTQRNAARRSEAQAGRIPASFSGSRLPSEL